MNTIWNFIMGHQTTAALVVMWIGSNIVTALPSPSNQSGGFYKFTFALVHGLAGSIPRIFPATRLFGDSTAGSKTYFGNGGGAVNNTTGTSTGTGAGDKK